MFGNPETTTGGNALKFYSSMRMEVRKIETITSAQEAIGNRIRVKIVKNKLAPPFREAEMEIAFGKGFSREASILDAGVKYGLIQKSGSWYQYQDKKIGQGHENAKSFLVANKDIAKAVEDKIRAVLMPKTEEPADKNDAKRKKEAVANADQKDLNL